MGGALGSRLCVLAAATLFSTGGAAIKLATLPGFAIAGLRAGFAAVALVLFVPAWRRFWNRRSLAVGCAYAATMILFVLSNTQTTAANAIFLQTSAPLWVLVLAPRLLGERNQPGDLARVGVLALGLALILAGDSGPLRTAPRPALGNALAVVSGLTLALGLLGLRSLARPGPDGDDEAAGKAIVSANVLACSFCLPLAWPAPAIGWSDWLVVSYLGVFQIGVAYSALVRGVRGLRAVEVSLLLTLEPVLNALFAFLVHGERPGALALAGSVLVLVGSLASTLRRAE